MSAGLYLTGKVWRFVANPNDDQVGGANPSGTVVYDTVSARIETEQPTLALLEQGLETPIIFVGILSPGTLILKHNDQFEVTAPQLSPYVNQKFRIIGIQQSSMIDPRAFIVVTMRRLEEAHQNVYQ